MYLAYVDDSARNMKKKTKFQVLTALVMKDEHFRFTEAVLGMSASLLIPEEKINSFEEFKACELYGGYGVFETIPQDRRFRAIGELLRRVFHEKMPVVYGVVDIDKLKTELYGSANPLDIAFRICAKGIEKCIKEIDPDQFALIISDDYQEKDIKNTLRKSFRELRKQVRPPEFMPGGKSPDTLWHIHDEMYFGDSKQSIGLQMADLCCFFIGKHIENSILPEEDRDWPSESFYNVIKDNIVHSQMQPDGGHLL